MTIKEFLSKNNIPFEDGGAVFVSPCLTPNCAGQLFINLKTGNGVCRDCNKEYSLAVIAQHYKVEGTIHAVEDGEVVYSSTPQAKPEKRRTQSDMLISLIASTGAILFHNEYNQPFIHLPVGNHSESWACGSKMFRRWASKLFWDTQGKAINSNSLKTALAVIEANACLEGKEYALANRAAWFEDAIWYDLSDSQWRAVQITPDGWTVRQQPILFQRYAHQQSQVEPIAGGDPKRVLKFVNLANKQQEILFMVNLVASLVPDFPHPVPSTYGPQGSAKSGMSKIMRRLTDPSSIEVVGFPRDAKELAQMLAHHWCLYFDNVSSLPEWISDTICRAVSGDGFPKRELYSDDEDIIYRFKRCIGINGINLVGIKPDLLERSILFELERVPPKRRREEKVLLKEFEAERALILGGIFDAIVGAMKIKPSIKRSQLPRMADFAVWGCAIAEALGYGQEAFMDAYLHNLSGQNEEVLGSSLVAAAVRSFMTDKTLWEDTPSLLLSELEGVALKLGINTTAEREWPKGANALSRRLNELKTNLAEDGIRISRADRYKKRIIRIEKDVENTVETDMPSEPAPNDPLL